MQHSVHVRAGRPARIGLLLVAVMGIAVLGVSPGAARDAFVAGARSTSPVAIDEPTRRTILERAARLGAALGLPEGPRRVASRLDDHFGGSAVDEVTTSDPTGRPLAIVRTTTAGQLRLAVRLGWSTAKGHLTAADAARRAAAVARSAGLQPAGRATVALDRTGRGWTVAWSRRVAGAPVRGDGVWVRLWPDGSLHSVAAAESPLAAVPSTTMSAEMARRLAEVQVATWSTAAEVGTVARLDLAWVAPNDLFDPTRPDAPEPVRRLAWVARVTPAAPLASRLRAIELYIDAGDGRLLGGDILE